MTASTQRIEELPGVGKLVRFDGTPDISQLDSRLQEQLKLFSGATRKNVESEVIERIRTEHKVNTTVPGAEEYFPTRWPIGQDSQTNEEIPPVTFQPYKFNIRPFHGATSADHFVVAGVRKYFAEIDLSGTSGESGKDGGKGEDGKPGIAGGDPAEAHGRPGLNGEAGQAGTDGTDAANATVSLSGTPEHLKVTVAGKELQLEESPKSPDAVLLIHATGGDGGAGGKGGDGGAGGNGANGAPATPEKDGGNGGNGGAGGAAGEGGSGGNAGKGGDITVVASDPRLLMLVEIANPPGAPGHNGLAGQGGKGGTGGAAGPAHTFIDDTKKKQTRPAGTKGLDGPRGTDGKLGRAGTEAAHGDILWKVVDAKGKTLESARSRFDAAVVECVLEDENQDMVFEPGTAVTVRGIVVQNVGELTLPAGAELTVPTSQTVVMDATNKPFKLPKLAPGERITVEATFTGKIRDSPEPTNEGILSEEAGVWPVVSLLGRPFVRRSTALLKVPVTYPIRLLAQYCRPKAGHNDDVLIELRLANASCRPYGSASACAGGVEVRILTTSTMMEYRAASGNSTSVSHAVTETAKSSGDGHSLKTLPKAQTSTTLACVPPAGQFVQGYKFRLTSLPELYSPVTWTAQLWLRGRLVQILRHAVIAAPTYMPLISADGRTSDSDVLLVLNRGCSRGDYVTWKRLLGAVGLTCDIWDAEYYGGISKSPNAPILTWQGHYDGKTIVFTFPSPDDAATTLQPEHIAAHLSSGPDSSVLWLCGGSSGADHFDAANMLMSKLAQGGSLTVFEDETYVSKRPNPSRDVAIQVANAILDNQRRLAPQHCHQILSVHFAPKQLLENLWSLGKLTVTCLPASLMARVVALAHFNISAGVPAASDKNVFDVATPAGMTLVALVFIQSIPRKLRMIYDLSDPSRAASAKPSRSSSLPSDPATSTTIGLELRVDGSKRPLSGVDLVGLCIYRDLKRAFTMRSVDPTHTAMKQLVLACKNLVRTGAIPTHGAGPDEPAAGQEPGRVGVSVGVLTPAGQQTFMVLWGVATRVNSSTFWTSLMPWSPNRKLRRAFKPLMQQLKVHMAAAGPAVLAQLVRDGKQWAKANKLPVQKLLPPSALPLELYALSDSKGKTAMQGPPVLEE